MTQECSESSNEGETWYGPRSFVSAAVGLAVNVIPFFINGYLIFILAVVYAIELAAVAVLCIVGGRARQAGAGIAVSLIGTAACFLLIPPLARFF